jgi:histidyl-tRNA synthetase
MGVERLVLLLETLNVLPASVNTVFDLYIAAEAKGIQPDVMAFAESLRSELPQLRIRTHCSGLKNIGNKARQSGAPMVILLKPIDDQMKAVLWANDQPEGPLDLSAVVASIKQKL